MYIETVIYTENRHMCIYIYISKHKYGHQYRYRYSYTHMMRVYMHIQKYVLIHMR